MLQKISFLLNLDYRESKGCQAQRTFQVQSALKKLPVYFQHVFKFKYYNSSLHLQVAQGYPFFQLIFPYNIKLIVKYLSL